MLSHWSADFRLRGQHQLAGNVVAEAPGRLADKLLDRLVGARVDDGVLAAVSFLLVTTMEPTARRFGTWATYTFDGVELIVVCREPGVLYVPDPTIVRCRYETGTPLLWLAWCARVGPFRMLRLLRTWGIPRRPSRFGRWARNAFARFVLAGS
ncbi:hypothetical protein [Kitasatospora griseola]